MLQSYNVTPAIVASDIASREGREENDRRKARLDTYQPQEDP